MTIDAKADEIFPRIVPQLAAKFLVVDLQVSGSPTYLTTPAIPLQDLFVKKAILLRIEFQAGQLPSQSDHRDSELLNYLGVVNFSSVLAKSTSG